MKKIKVGIVGCGVIGGVLKKWLEENNSNCEFLVSDPPKGYNDNLSSADIIFISIHIPTEKNSSQNLNLLKSILANLPDKPIFIRTTLLPGTCDLLSKEFSKQIYFMPEFLTERTAYEDFCLQPMVFTGEVELLKEIFKGKEYFEMTSTEAEIAKYAHNVFGALKVTYFNGIYDLAEKMNCNYENIRKGFLLSKYIGPTHTMVPGPDGKFGYGGKCFPKDVEALKTFTEDCPISSMIKLIAEINEIYRENKVYGEVK